MQDVTGCWSSSSAQVSESPGKDCLAVLGRKEGPDRGSEMLFTASKHGATGGLVRRT